MMGLATMWTCHWSARRIQRYLDADPSAPLSAQEIRRLESHLAICARCSAAVAEHRGLRRALARWASRRGPDPLLADRMRQAAERLIAQDAG